MMEGMEWARMGWDGTDVEEKRELEMELEMEMGLGNRT